MLSGTRLRMSHDRRAFVTDGFLENFSTKAVTAFAMLTVT